MDPLAQLTPAQEAANAAAARPKQGAKIKAPAAASKASSKKAREKAPPKPKAEAKAAKPKASPVIRAAKAVKDGAKAAAQAVLPTPKMRKPRAGKTQTMIDMLSRKEGATLAQMVAASGWNEQSLKWFMQATLGKKKGLKVVHEGEGAARVYRIEAAADVPEAV